MTKIEWTDETWNPVTGCTKISPGCKHCYAERMAHRLAGRCGYPEAPNEFKVTQHPDKLGEPYHWKKPRNIFVVSMGDLFHKDVPFEFVDRVLERICTTPQHTYQILTKRTDRAMKYFNLLENNGFVPENIWLGTSIENQAQVKERLKCLLLTQGVKRRFISAEPLLGPLNIEDYLNLPFDGIDWVIAGCESGPKRRPADIDWFRSLRDQCVRLAVPFFLKQMDVKGKVVKLPKLDGKVWKEMPVNEVKRQKGDGK
jgi:protein gp37